MSALTKLINAVYWLSLCIWVSVLISAGVSAMSAFTALPDPDLGLHLEKFAAYDEARHGYIAAGKVMEPIFTFVDVMQLVVGVIALLALVLQLTLLRMPWKQPANAIRTACIVLAMGLFLFRAATITPEMNQDLRTYWSAAETGDVETAEQARQSFDAAHRRARPLFDSTLFLLLIGIGASGAAFSGRGGSDNPPRDRALERPALLNRNQ